MRYEFSLSGGEGNYVAPDKEYSSLDPKDQIKYGFLVEENRNKEERLQLPELNSGFDTVYWYRGRSITTIAADEHGCFISSEKPETLPCTFVTDVLSKGNYQVTVTLFAERTIKEAMIFLGRRRLAFVGEIQAGSYWTRTFITNICPIIPRNHSEEMEDTTLDVTILGDGLHLKSLEVEPIDCKTIYIAGDSTVTDQSADYPYYPYHSYCGWGQMLSYYVGTQAAISNHSHSGLTTESFRSEGHYKILIDQIKAGDICLFQFAHNDQKLLHLKAEEGYKENLYKYIGEIKEKGATPILVSPLARNTWKGNDDSYNDLLIDYARVCKELAAECEIPLVELHKKSKELVMRMGKEQVKAYFFPSDYTHSNDYGAFLFAEFVYEDLVSAKIIAPNKEIAKNVFIPPKEMPEIVPPMELADIEDPNAERLFEHLERPNDLLTRVEALELVITAMHFFPTNVYNDAFDDVIGHEVYAGTVECAYQNGLIPDTMVEDKKFYPTSQISGTEFLAIVENGYKSRKGKLKLNASMKSMKTECVITRSAAAELCRQLHI
ncbi:MAG: GDSL-type esterase/lipase family protein [bacterium]|nr:GDSL-type esterase/lipase family protein [bacterium]